MVGVGWWFACERIAYTQKASQRVGLRGWLVLVKLDAIQASCKAFGRIPVTGLNWVIC